MKIQMIGDKFGRLKVIEEYNRTKDNHIKWLCVCDCGNMSVVDGRDLRRGKVLSCGCYNIEKATKRITKYNTKHSDCKTRLYNIWNNMKDRCTRNNNKNYCHYGGRGIKVCDEWKNDYLSFKKWALENSYEDDLTLDRIDVNGDYEPDNCRWITLTEQANNKRSNHFITFQGITLTVTEWNTKMGYKRGLINDRLHHGWSIERAILEKPFIGKNQNFKKDIDY